GVAVARDEPIEVREADARIDQAAVARRRDQGVVGRLGKGEVRDRGCDLVGREGDAILPLRAVAELGEVQEAGGLEQRAGNEADAFAVAAILGPDAIELEEAGDFVVGQRAAIGLPAVRDYEGPRAVFLGRAAGAGREAVDLRG